MSKFDIHFTDGDKEYTIMLDVKKKLITKLKVFSNKKKVKNVRAYLMTTTIRESVDNINY